jgi:hypothetical protein
LKKLVEWISDFVEKMAIEDKIWLFEYDTKNAKISTWNLHFRPSLWVKYKSYPLRTYAYKNKQPLRIVLNLHCITLAEDDKIFSPTSKYLMLTTASQIEVCPSLPVAAKIMQSRSCFQLINHPAMKMCRGVEVWIHLFFTSTALHSLPQPLYLQSPDTHWVRGCVGPESIRRLWWREKPLAPAGYRTQISRESRNTFILFSSLAYPSTLKM